jgi:hypothetical protein
MVLLSQMFRSQAVYGSTDASWFETIVGRQGGRWAKQHVQAAMPAPPPRPPQRPQAESWQAVADLRNRGVISDPEADELRRKMDLR